MVSNNKKRRKNNRNNKKNNIKKEKELDEQNPQIDNTETEVEHSQNVEYDEGPSNKRHFDENDSDTEEQPQKKKKKKQLVPTESSDKKGKKSIRQMKREKHAQRQAEAAAAAKDQLKSLCISYLLQWKHDKQNWKFMKAKQVWLYKNKFSSFLVPDSSWPLLLEYFESAQGNIRNMLLDDAKKIIKSMDDWTETQSKDNNEEKTEGKDDTTPEVNRPDETTYKRARELIQCLQE